MSLACINKTCNILDRLYTKSAHIRKIHHLGWRIFIHYLPEDSLKIDNMVLRVGLEYQDTVPSGQIQRVLESWANTLWHMADEIFTEEVGDSMCISVWRHFDSMDMW